MWDKARKENGSFNIVYLIIAGFLAIIIILLYVHFNPVSGGSTSTHQAEMLAGASSEEEILYIRNVENILFSCGDSLTYISQLFEDYEPGNSDWDLSMAVEIYIIRNSIEIANSLSPPSSMLNIHEIFLSGMEHYNNSINLLEYSLDNFDIESLNEATEEMKTATSCNIQALELLLVFKEEHNIN